MKMVLYRSSCADLCAQLAATTCVLKRGSPLPAHTYPSVRDNITIVFTVFAISSHWYMETLTDDDGLFNGDSLSMAKKLHDVRKNSSTDLLVRDPAVYEPQLGCADSSEESNPAGFVIEPQSELLNSSFSLDP